MQKDYNSQRTCKFTFIQILAYLNISEDHIIIDVFCDAVPVKTGKDSLEIKV